MQRSAELESGLVAEGMRALQAMRANIRASQHMWRYDFTSEYIIRRVNATWDDPQLNAYRPNSTNCGPAEGRGGGGTAAYSGADGAAIRC